MSCKLSVLFDGSWCTVRDRTIIEPLSDINASRQYAPPLRHQTWCKRKSERPGTTTQGRQTGVPLNEATSLTYQHVHR